MRSLVRVRLLRLLRRSVVCFLAVAAASVATSHYGLAESFAVEAVSDSAETSQANSGAVEPEEGVYAGSGACEGCHAYIYKRWRATRHSHSVLTGAEAERAGYPLPAERPAGKAMSAYKWADISYVFGGRQRIAYADQSGRVLDTSFHHRVAGWDVFPTLQLSACTQCHHTGVGAGPDHDNKAAFPGRWVERNIGCEACHGAGARHVETLEKQDINKNPSSNVCGQCHTAVGKILPKGELHDTHDLVQNWNRDPHVTSLQGHTYDAFCANCHSPYDGVVLESPEDAGRKVYHEARMNITCVGCHNPHDLTNAAYTPEQVTLTKPLPVKPHTYEGNDSDFTTTDHREWEDASQACESCHRGADRVDLDHANATCIDCHNTYKRNHSAESRQFHDTNEPRLSCRGCHQDATHLMSILYQDPDFLDPKHVHNLRSLPSSIRSRYKFSYPGLLPVAAIAAIDSASASKEALAIQPARRAALPTVDHRLADLEEILTGIAHVRLAADVEVARLHKELMDAPGSTRRHIQLAEAYAQRGEHTAARDILDHAVSLDSSRLLLELALGVDAERENIETAPALRVAVLLPATEPLADESLRSWLEGFLALEQGLFTYELEFLPDLPANASISLLRALALLGQGQYREARKLLEDNVQKYPDHHASEAALGYLHLLMRRTSLAVTSLQKAIELAPGEGSARLLLGHARLRSDDMSGALAAYRDAIEVEPSLLEARFALARALQYTGRLDLSAQVYQLVIEREPQLFEARYALASVFKLISDSLAFQSNSVSESNPPATTGSTQWRIQLDDWENQITEYRNLALVELAAATRLRPTELDSYRQVAEIYRRSGRLEEAERFYSWLEIREPLVWMHGYRLGVIQLAQGRHAQAAETLQAVIARAPTDGDSYLALGLALVRSDRMDEAIPTMELATRYEPFNPSLYTNLGAAYATSGDFTRAQMALERSLELHSFPLPRVHLTQTNLALVHLREGRRDEGVLALRRALHSYADYPLANELLGRLVASSPSAGEQWPPFQYNLWLERFGEVTTVAFNNE